MNNEYDYSGFVPIIAIIITLIATFYFKSRIRPILLVGNEANIAEQRNLATRMMAPQNYSEFKMKAIENPFMINYDSVKSSLDDGVYFKIINNNPSNAINMLIAWSVDIEKFFDDIEKSVHESFYAEMDQVSFLKDNSSLINRKRYLPGEYNGEELSFKVPEECIQIFRQNEQLNQTRKSYHIVLALFRDKGDLDAITVNDVAVNIWVLHLKDKKLSSKIVSNYSKCLNDRIININTIFSSQEENVCVVCLTERSSQVLLPCSHNCLCSTCIKKVNLKCPVCRAYFTSSFKV